MKNKPAVLLLAALISAAMLGGCASGPNSAASASSQSQSAVKLADRNWDSFNKAQIEKLIATYGKASPNYNPAKPPYVVFDWDNTMVFLDVEEATLIYQLENLRFAMTPEQMDKALRMSVPKTNFVKDYNNAAGQPVNIDLVVPDAVDSYRWIYANYKGLKGTLSLEEIKKNPHYTNFVTKVRYMYEAIGDTFDVSVAYPWVLYLFTGMNESQVRGMVNETLAWQKNQPIEKVKWTSPASLPGKAGVVSVSWKNGLRLLPEMQELIKTFRDSGIDTWICTASFVDVIKEISSNPAYGYNNPADRVIGMELERDANGIIQTEFRKGYAQTQQKGKTQALNRFVVPKYGYGPIFVAGDSEGDMNMMQDFSDTKLVLIVNRLKGKDIATLSKQAVESYGKPDAKILLQGRNDNTGEFVKSQEHIKFGAKDGKGQVLK
jgi:phosphoserine phosphatase